MNLMITGANGQLGSEIKLLSNNYQLSTINYFFSDIDDLDITDYNKLEKYITENKIDCIINCAAYTAVDKAESEPELATKINVNAVSNLAKISKQYNLLLIHVSTDYVFDGMNYKPYLETNQTNPQSVYGKTKLLGENEIIKQYLPSPVLGEGQGEVYQARSTKHEALIIRTSWLYSSFGNNFVKSIIKNAKEKGKLNVVYDQIGTPTYARDLAKAILDIVSIENSSRSFLTSASSQTSDLRLQTSDFIPQTSVEIYNYSNEGVCSWYDFAKAIIELSDINCTINPIETKDYPTPAKRPHYSVLNKDKIKQKYGITIPYWRDSLIDCLSILNADNK